MMVPGVAHVWNLEAPDLFTRTVRARIRDAPLPQKLVVLSEKEEKQRKDTCYNYGIGSM
jgi:hypothetical protein